MIPTLDGVHHLKLPVTDLNRSIDWYRTRLVYTVAVEFHEHGNLAGVALSHPDGGPQLGLRLDPDRARAAAGFDYFSIGVPDKAAMEALAAHLTGLGEAHAGVHFATIGWILPHLHDPDGHEVRFYTTDQHTDLGSGTPLVIDDAVATARVREKDWQSRAPVSRPTSDPEL
jgi:catechol 2,3-dioxygenase-like lactoylglutathione lyase family enzyme